MPKTNTRLVFEITTSRNWGEKKPCGIPRTEKKIGAYLIKTVKPEEIAFCYYSPELNAFFEIERKEAIKYITASPKLQPEQVKSSPVYFSTQNDHFSKVNKYSGIIQILKDIRQVFRSTGALARHIARKIVHSKKPTPPEIATSSKSPHPNLQQQTPFTFRSSDFFLYVAPNWDCRQVTRLRELKKQYNFKVAAYCHDLIPIRGPQYVPADVPENFRKYSVESYKGADLILCNSKFTQKDLMAFLEEIKLPNKVTGVIHHGEELEDEQVPRKPNTASLLDKNNFILFVSSIDPRKNQELLYHVWIKLAQSDLRKIPYLVLVGTKTWGMDDLLEFIHRDPRVKDKIFTLTNVSDQELSWLYKNCLFTLYPSFYEGWGLPPSESIRYGKLCISSNTTSLPEVGGNLVMYLDPYDTISWYKAIYDLIRNPKNIKAYEDKIKKEYKPWSWDQAGQQVLENIEKIGGKFLTPEHQ